MQSFQGAVYLTQLDIIVILRAKKIIKAFKARLGFANFPNITNIVMYGVPNVKDKKKLIRELGDNENVYNVSRSSGNLFIVHAFIRKLNELDYLVSFIRKTGEISELTVGIDKGTAVFASFEKKKLSETDYLIIDSLKENSRKNISDISEELGISTKTASRRLENLVNNHLVNFFIDWFPGHSNQMIPLIFLKFKSNLIIDDDKLIEELRQKYGSKILFIWSFSNLPNTKIVNFWVNNVNEITEIENAFINDDRFESVEVTIPIEGAIFPTWIEKELETKIQEIKKIDK